MEQMVAECAAEATGWCGFQVTSRAATAAC